MYSHLKVQQSAFLGRLYFLKYQLMIQFIEHPVGGYKERTIQNIKDSEVTIAIAVDFNSHGEVLTKSQCIKQDKLYIPINYYPSACEDANVAKLFQSTNTIFISGKRPIKCLNIAGNGIYNLPDDQELVDVKVYNWIKWIDDLFGIETVVTGGQTGIDEAGAKAADFLTIPTIVRAPKNWLFRNVRGKDIADEKLFKARFNY